MAPFWHRWSYFSIINLSVFHLADKCFTITNLINLRIILFLEYRKTPETLRFRGILRLDTMLSYDNKSIFRLYYSMIVATRPDPTVRPPSRRWCPNPWRYPGQSPLVLACPYPRSLSCGLSHAKSIAQAERGFPTKYGKASRVLQGFLGGVRQKAAATTCRAPAWRRVRAASFRVAPVVRMSSRRRTRCPATWAGWGAV